jgi:uncharacterized membrane protein YphA (DoxX/SURF4 family)
MTTFHCLSVLFTSLFFAILFLQSGIDKIVDWKGNYEYHRKHFAKSPLSSMAPALLASITLLEVSCGLLSLSGFFYMLIKNDSLFTFYGCSLAAIDFLALFFGQRLSKDYAGAASLVPYFILSLMGMYLSAGSDIDPGFFS